MYRPDKYTVVATNTAEIPRAGLAATKPQVAAALGSSVGEMFPEFAAGFPRTVAAMEASWSKPRLALRDMGRAWIANLFIERDDFNLFFDDPYPLHASEPYFDVSMLPPAWAVLYRSMSSFTITTGSSYSPVGWRNTPLPQSKDIEWFSLEAKIDVRPLNEFARRLGVTEPRSLRCWLLTDSIDSLWIDEQHRNRKVYHVESDRFDDALALADPDRTLDLYLAHVATPAPPDSFQFRAVGRDGIEGR